MVFIEIDGKKLEAQQGQMIIEVADSVGIPIPRFCYHKKLSIAANCRMCLVEVGNAPKPLPACATPVTEGMKIFTTSVRARDAQKSVMEFLLINHPLDCPICDQGGQCELQDVALEYGKDVSRYTEGKRVIKDKSLGPLIATDMTRCIHCTRCVRFGAEVAGMREMGATGRGEFMEIGTYVEESVKSELSGNVIDLCPVGALTSKPFRFKARAWELQSLPSVSPHDCLGSNVFFHVFRDKVIRTLPRENEAVNEVWLSDRDRFSYEGLNHADRLEQPWVKRNGQWIPATWSEALTAAVEKLSALDPKDCAALASPNSTVEEFYLLQKLWRAMGSSNIDHRLRQTDFSHQDYLGAYPALGITPSDLATQESIFLIGCDIRKEQPLLAHRIRQATLQGGKVFGINSLALDANFPLEENWAGDLIEGLQAMLKGLQANHGFGTKISIILGAYAWSHPQAGEVYRLSRELANILGASWGEISNGANSAGGWIAGAVAHRLPMGQKQDEPGLTGTKMWEACKGFLLLQCEPEYDCANPALAKNALLNAQAVVVMSAYDNPHFREYADVLLPVTPISEMAGTYINAMGEWQNFAPAVMSYGQSRPAWKVLRVLGNLLKIPEFNYESIEEVTQEIKALNADPLANSDQLASHAGHYAKTHSHDDLIRLAPTPLYAVDGITRRADALQQTFDAQQDKVTLNSAEAKKRNLSAAQKVWVVQDGAKSTAALPIEIDERLPNGFALVAGGIESTHTLGAPFGHIQLKPLNKGEAL